MTQPFPPANYKEVESKVAGIQVFAPVAAAAAAPEADVVTFDCPQCGATTAYSAANRGLTCTHCGYVEQPKAQAVGTDADEFEFTVETVERSSQGWGLERKEVVCQNCGAITTAPPNTLSHTCTFCGSNKVIQRAAPQDNLRPRFLIPFQLETEKCLGVAREWLGSSWMTPDNLKEIASLGGFNAIYLPFWTFDARIRAHWKAEVGHTRTETYRENGETKTRTRIDWRWEQGQVNQTVDDLLISGTNRVSRLLLNKMRQYDLGALCLYDPKYLAGIQSQAYEVTLEDAWAIGRNEMREQAKAACEGQASTSMIRNFSMNLDFSDESWRYVLLPVYISAYPYEGKTYQVLVNGQTGAIAGQRPVDWGKVWLRMLLLAAPGLLLGLIGLITLPLAGIGMVIGTIGFVVLLIGLVIDVIIFIQANELDDA